MCPAERCQLPEGDEVRNIKWETAISVSAEVWPRLHDSVFRNAVCKMKTGPRERLHLHIDGKSQCFENRHAHYHCSQLACENGGVSTHVHTLVHHKTHCLRLGWHMYCSIPGDRFQDIEVHQRVTLNTAKMWLDLFIELSLLTPIVESYSCR